MDKENWGDNIYSHNGTLYNNVRTIKLQESH